MRYKITLFVPFFMYAFSLCAAEPATSESKPKNESPAEHYRKHGDNCPAFEQTPKKYRASRKLLLYYLNGYRNGVRTATIESRWMRISGSTGCHDDCFPSNDEQHANADGYQSGKAEMLKEFRELRSRTTYVILHAIDSEEDFRKCLRTMRETGILDQKQEQNRQSSSTPDDNRPAFDHIPAKYRTSSTLLTYYLMGYRVGARVAAIQSRALATDGDVPSTGEFHPADDKQHAYTDGYNSGKAELCKAFHKLYTRLPHEYLEERPAIMQYLLRKAQEADTSALDQQGNRQPAPTRGLAGTPDWFALGEEVYHASDIITAQKKVLSFLKERRWFVRGDLAAPYPATIAEVPATSEDASLVLAVTPTADSRILQFTLVLTAKQRDLFRSYQHRENNVLPVLFAFFSDGKAIKFAKAGGLYTSVGGASSPDILVKSGKIKTWQVNAATQSLVALLPATSPQTISVVAAFSEFNHGEYPPASLVVPELAVDDSDNREDPDAAPLIRSNIVRLEWDGTTWNNLAAEPALSEWNAKIEVVAEHYRKHGDDCPAFEQTPDKYEASPELLFHYVTGFRDGARVAIQMDGKRAHLHSHPSDDKKQAYADGYNSGNADLTTPYNDLTLRIVHQLGDRMDSDFDQLLRTIRETGRLYPAQPQNGQPWPTLADGRLTWAATPGHYKATPRLLIYYLMGYRIGARVAVIECRSMGIDRDGPSSGDFDPSNDKQRAYADGYRTGRAEMRNAFEELRARTAREWFDRVFSSSPELRQLLPEKQNASDG